MKTASVIPFPIARRRAFIERQANYAAEINHDAAERHISTQVAIQVAAMRRRGISEDLIAHEAKLMEAAIRAALWRAVLTPGAV